MKVRLIACGFVLGISAAFGAGQALSQDPGQMSPEEMQKMMAEYLKSMQPGAYHQMLEGSIGEWTTTTKMWWEGPEGEPMVTHGTSTRKWVLGKRFVLQEDKSTMMMPDPATGALKETPWEGMGLSGYDNGRNLFVSCWVDNMSTAILTMKGTASPDGKVINYYGEMDEPMMNMYGRTVKYVARQTGPDSAVFEIIDLAAGDNYKVVEVTYQRKK